MFNRLLALVVAGWLLLAAIDPDGYDPNGVGSILAGYILGTVFGHVSLAAAWCALGPLPLVQRLSFSFTWVAAVLVSLGCVFARTFNPQGFSMLLVYGGAMVLQWVIFQVPVWLAVTRYGLWIGLEADGEPRRDHRNRQFGIRQIMILTVLVAMVLGIGRLTLGGLKAEASFKELTEGLIFAYLAFSNAVVSLPLIGAVLLRRKALIATCVALLVSVFATAIELSLLSLWAPTFDWVLALVNGFQIAWVLGVLFILRSGGFRLMSRGKAHL